MFDLAKALGVKEDEEFRFIDNDTLYRVHDNLLEYYCGDDCWLSSTLRVNEILKCKINKIWMPKVGKEYYTVDFSMWQQDNIIKYDFKNDSTDMKLLQAGLVFKTKEEAKDMADYLIKKAKEYRKID